MFRPLDLIARYLPVFKKPQGLLIVRMDGIGDMVLFRTALDHYSRALAIPRSEITVLGCSSWESLADVVFAGYRVHAIDEHAYARRPFYRFKVSLFVRRLAPAVTVNDSYFRRALMADSLAWISAAPKQVASLPYINEPTRAEYLYYLSQVGEVVHTGDYPTHEVVRHYNFISALAGREIEPETPKIDWREAANPLKDLGEGGYIVLNPGSNEPGRRWPLAGYLEVARRLRGEGHRVVFVGKPGEMSGETALKTLSDDPSVIDLCGRTSLPELMDLMKGARAVISNDSGPAHLSIALGTPTVVIVGGGHFGCFFPYPPAITPGNARFVYEEMECYHCFWRCPKRESKFDVFPCISAVHVDRVWAGLTDLVPPTGKGAS